MLYSAFTNHWLRPYLEYLFQHGLLTTAKTYLTETVQRWFTRMVPALWHLHDKRDLPVLQLVLLVYGVAPTDLSDLCVPATAISGRQHLRSAATGTLLVPCARTATGQRSFPAVIGPAWQPHGTVCHHHYRHRTCRPVGERLQAGTEDAPVRDCPALLRRFHDSGAGYKYPDLFTYLWTMVLRTQKTDWDLTSQKFLTWLMGCLLLISIPVQRYILWTLYQHSDKRSSHPVNLRWVRLLATVPYFQPVLVGEDILAAC